MKKILELIKGLYNWLNTDGLLHISFTSMVITFSFPLIKWWSVGLAVLVGLAKEAYDILVKKSDPKLSIHDLICNCIGVIMTVILILVGYANMRGKFISGLIGIEYSKDDQIALLANGEDSEEHSKELADFMKIRSEAKKNVDEVLSRFNSDIL